MPPPMNLTRAPKSRGDHPGAYWEVDFTEVKPGKYGYRYLLWFVALFQDRQRHVLPNMKQHRS